METHLDKLVMDVLQLINLKGLLKVRKLFQHLMQEFMLLPNEFCHTKLTTRQSQR
jgi:hypothetical protein